MTEADVTESQRIDKWLWHARIARTRTAAAGLVTGGHVRVNRTRVTRASHALRPDDVVTLAFANRVLVLRVVSLVARRGPAQAARETYVDLSPLPREPADGARSRGTGRPTKRERREIDAWKSVPLYPSDSTE